jgi:hypothetical protein
MGQQKLGKQILGLAGTLMLAVPVFASSSIAAPVTVAPVADAAVVRTDVTPVQYGRFSGRPAYRAYARPYAARGYGYRPFVGFGIGAAIIGGAIIANNYYAPRRGYYYDTYDYTGPYYYPSDYRGDPREVCARHFKSFEWRTGLYTTYHGEKRVCPYLGV